MTARLMIGTPCVGGQVSSLYAQSVLHFQSTCLNRKDIQLELVAHWGDSLTTRALQGLVTQLLGHPSATHLLFINGNIGFEPEQVFRLLNFDGDIAAAALPLKKTGQEKPRGTTLFDFVPDTSVPETKNGFVKARSAGTGLMLIKRAILQTMASQYQNLRYRSEFGTPPEDPRYWSYALFNCLIEEKTNKFLSADESFCKRWIDLDGKIWIDLKNVYEELGKTY